MAAQRGRPGRADPPAHVHAARGAGDGRARACARRASRPERGPDRGRHVPLGRPPDGSPARLLARPRPRLRRARRGRRRRPARPRAPGAGPRGEATALSARPDDARHLLAHGQRPDAAGETFWRSRFRGARSTARRSRRASAPTERASARSACSISTTCSSYWRALAARRDDRAAHGRTLRARARRRVPGRQRPAGRHRAKPARARRRA